MNEAPDLIEARLAMQPEEPEGYAWWQAYRAFAGGQAACVARARRHRGQLPRLCLSTSRGGEMSERTEAERRLDLILHTLYSTHGFLDADGEIDTAAKFRAIERLARIDWPLDLVLSTDDAAGCPPPESSKG